MTEAMREQFEAWLASQGFTAMPERRATGTYVNGQIQGNWLAYQAALRSPAVAGLVEAAKDAADALDEVGKSAVWPLRAALAPFTGAGHE